MKEWQHDLQGVLVGVRFVPRDDRRQSGDLLDRGDVERNVAKRRGEGADGWDGNAPDPHPMRGANDHDAAEALPLRPKRRERLGGHGPRIEVAGMGRDDRADSAGLGRDFGIREQISDPDPKLFRIGRIKKARCRRASDGLLSVCSGQFVRP